jgi:AraC-like DNA-binding protein
MSTSVAMRNPMCPVEMPNLVHARDTLPETIRHAADICRAPYTGGLAGWQVSRVRAFIDDHLNQPIKVKNLSDVARLSAAYFSRAFKKSFGSAPHAYLIQRRLDHARQLMLTSDARLSDIALNCGFTDQAHLCKLFRRNTGQSPAAWRHQRRAAVKADRLVLLEWSQAVQPAE